MSCYMRIEILSFQTLWALRHVSLTLGPIIEDLQDALLTKLLGQFIEEHRSRFFKRL